MGRMIKYLLLLLFYNRDCTSKFVCILTNFMRYKVLNLINLK